MKKIIICLLFVTLASSCSFNDDKRSNCLYWGINDNILYLSPTKQGNAVNKNETLINSSEWNDVPWFYDNGKFDCYKKINVEKVIILKDNDKKIVPSSTANWFTCLTKCREIEGLENIDTSYVTNMCEMFSATNITSLDLTSFNTSNVTNMERMFFCCGELKNVNLSSFNTHNVTNMSWMFDGCLSLENIDVSNFDTSNVEFFTSMFQNTLLTEENTDVSNFDISKAKDISSTSYLFGFHY